MPTHVPIFFYIIYGIVFVVGLLNVICPKFIWHTFESWKATKEPTKAFFMVRRITGVIAMAIIIAILLFPYLRSLS